MVFALSSCATASVTHAELKELTASVTAMRAEQARLEARLVRLEQQTTVAQARSAPAVAVAPRPAEPTHATLPALTVVKMKPRREAAPVVMTNVDVVEPSPGVVQELKGAAQKPDETDIAVADGQFEHGLESLRTGNVEGGVVELLKFAAEWPHHAQADNAMYFAGVGKMGLEDWEGAARTFEDALSRYPAGDAVLDSMLKLAECRVRQSRPQDARAAWEKIVASFPGTAAAAQAQARLASTTPSSHRSP